jgi:membrane associated rhomboid family serine protease
MSPLGIDETLLRIVSLGTLVGALVLCGFALARLGEDDNRLAAGLRERFVFGIPWGTVIVILLVYGIYYLVQGGGKPGGPIVVGFRSWSLWYPESILFSSFTHSSESHLIGNLTGTLAFAPIAEYAWRHYPENRDHEHLGEWWYNPYARIALFVLAVFLLGLLGAVIVPGPVIGFSGVVFAFAGFALVTFPITTVLAILGLQVVRLVYRSVTDPWIVAVSREQFVRPWWADIAIQGHLYGLLVGVLLAAAFVQYRDQSPNVRHVFFAALVFAVSRSLQYINWPLGNERYVLFQAIGTAAVLVLALLITVAVLDEERMFIPQIDLRVHTTGAGILLALVLALAVLGIPYNLVSVSGGEEVENGIEVRDYTVTYAENVPDRYASSLDLPVYQGPSVNVSGVIVASEQRNIWERRIPAGELAARGSATVVLGDAIWRETVRIQRTTWRVTGGNSTYKVFGQHDDNDPRQLFVSEPAIARPVIDGKRVAIQPAESFYNVAVLENENVVGFEQIPPDGENVTVADITFERDGQKLIAVSERTAVQIGRFER